MATAERVGIAVEVQEVQPGEDWFTWRGTLRRYQPGPGRKAWNAYVDGTLAGSVCVCVREASAYEWDAYSGTWDYADCKAAYYTGPLFVDPAWFNHDPLFLDLQSVFVHPNFRRQGVAAALIDQARMLGMPVFARFADEHLGRYCECLSASLTDTFEEDWVYDTTAHQLMSDASFAVDDPDFLDGMEPPFGQGEVKFAFTVVELQRMSLPASPDYDPGRRSATQGEPAPVGTREQDIVEVISYEEDGGWHRENLIEGFKGQLERAGVKVSEIRGGRFRADARREGRRLRVYVSGHIENELQLFTVARFRRFLAALAPTDNPSSLAETLADVLRDPDHGYRIERVTFS